ncbi:hypothetical protein B0J12DRAFT_196668 [Macrophomina phaseolina]|uniref:Uncharacterized protein n=1 Tax=Macrophomina phaseolina TaxID=35725 RepID=A0ABQ8G5L1_9PEZI|nr:hypothetical protein B0J12DRAFT_196668 [Macrophomina phaseolina]
MVLTAASAQQHSRAPCPPPAPAARPQPQSPHRALPMTRLRRPNDVPASRPESPRPAGPAASQRCCPPRPGRDGRAAWVPGQRVRAGVCARADTSLWTPLSWAHESRVVGRRRHLYVGGVQRADAGRQGTRCTGGRPLKSIAASDEAGPRARALRQSCWADSAGCCIGESAPVGCSPPHRPGVTREIARHFNLDLRPKSLALARPTALTPDLYDRPGAWR